MSTERNTERERLIERLKAARIWIAEHSAAGNKEATKELRLIDAALRTPRPESRDGEMTFEQAWAEKERAGFQYGSDALEQVRMGWDMHAAIPEARRDA